MPSSQQAHFAAAAARWADIILGEVPDLAVSLGANACSFTLGLFGYLWLAW